MKKAFTLVEVMIVVVIIGLLAAMWIPAMTSVKVNKIAKDVYDGRTVSNSDYEYLATNIKLVDDKYRVKQPLVELIRPASQPLEQNIIMVIDGKKYKLVPQ